MSKSDLYDIVNTKDALVSIPQTSHFTIGTSPYYAHQHGLAIDIYYNHSLENYEVLSPVSGKVLKTKTLSAPKPKFLNGVDKDYLILINNPNNSEVLYKTLHVKPSVQVGEQIKRGDPIGKTIRNGYFAYWSSPHLHLEIRPFKDAIRARGGEHFSLAIENKNNIKENFENVQIKQIPVEIQNIFPEFILARFPKYFYHEIFPIYGVKVRVNHLNCILDGGIPHYKIGTIIFPQKFNSNIFHSVYLRTHQIGTLHEIYRQFGFFKFDYVKLFLNKKEIRGISLYLANFLPLIKIIPYKKDEFSFNLKSTQYLSIITE